MESRFIPACVGNSREWHRKVTAKAVHPRVCGEQCFLPSRSSLASGSSPRVWGTVVGVAMQVLAARFIPACVGNRLSLYPISF